MKNNYLLKQNTIYLSNEQINCLLLLNNNILLCGISDGSIILYNILNYYKIMSIKEHSDGINYLIQIPFNNKNNNNNYNNNYFNYSNYKIISCSSDSYLNIYSLKINNYTIISYLIEKKIFNNSPINKILYIQNKNILISCSSDKKIKVYDNNNYEIITNINLFNLNNSYEINNILEINNEILITSYKEKSIKFLNINTFQTIKTINNIVINAYQNSLALFNDNILIIGSIQKIIFLNVITKRIIKIFKIHYRHPISFLIIDNKHFLTGEKEGKIKYYKYYGNELKKLYEYDNYNNIINAKEVSSIIKLENNKIITSCYDGSINIYNINF